MKDEIVINVAAYKRHIESLSYKKAIEQAKERVETKDGPYWAIVWIDFPTGRIGSVNYGMTEDRARQMFEKCHPETKEYRMIGKDK